MTTSPITVVPFKQPLTAYLDIARIVSGELALDYALVCAVIEQESGWDPWAVRFEPLFEERYIKPKIPKLPTTEEMCEAMSFGLMQVMGATARGLGFKGRFLLELCDPHTGITYGCLTLKQKILKAGGSINQGLLYYNGGGNKNYPSQVLNRLVHYRD